mmetsp:Transcript_7230/g.16356  ORF Transcript_7230/g.16356 Transcript_7230/m.16356 type:complete len:214 (+) Transcript_7230:121-762(+)
MAGGEVKGDAEAEGPATVTVSVRKLNGSMVGTFTVAVDGPVSSLKEVIHQAGGPPGSEQQLVAGHRVLKDDDPSGEALTNNAGGLLFLVEVSGCPTCQGPCACSLCGCQPQHGLIDYYGCCKECGKCGGHASSCKFCMQCFPSLCALDTHVRFVHPDLFASEWQTSRFSAHIEKRGKPGAPRAAIPEPNTFMEACRGGLGDCTGSRGGRAGSR